MRRQSIKRDVWYIRGCEKRQTGGFSLAASLTGPILGSIAAPVLKK